MKFSEENTPTGHSHRGVFFFGRIKIDNKRQQPSKARSLSPMKRHQTATTEQSELVVTNEKTSNDNKPGYGSSKVVE